MIVSKHPKVSSDIYVAPNRPVRGGAIPLKTNVPINVVPDKTDLSLRDKVLHPRPIKKSIYEEIAHELQDHNPTEKIVWIGRSSQMIHLKAYIVCGFLCWLIFPILIAYIIYLHTKNTIYVVTQERMRVHTGIFSKRIDDLEWYRVKDTAFIQPFIFRFFGLSNIQLYSSDISWGQSSIPGVENGMELREKIRRIVELARVKKGVREVDYYTSPMSSPQIIQR